ncbi:alpha/beta hydrolase [Speluncibacter jeojiensis]|uniref:Alpha/beta hydrolase n=1 Tax=Speluncibacter jeojiensis TaxID=2710754 RepID=A0A9X4LYC9_9ACTN|nr:alpha/beta hydrolase [Corynebacteriales bacterium D3-21]
MTSNRCTLDPVPRRSTVPADDGVPLAVQEFGDRDAPVVAVFVHGHCLRAESWAFLRAHLAGLWGDGVRMVFYDQRGHGESGAAPTATYTIDQLGRDLGAVVRTISGDRQVVLVGHSMGGMAVLSYVHQHPEVVGDRVVGIGMIASAADGVADRGLGRLLLSPAVTAFRAAVQRAPRTMERSKRATRRLGTSLVRVAAFGNQRVAGRVATLAAAMVNETSVVTMSGFIGSLIGFDERHALTLVAGIPALVLCGSADLMTPFEHSASMAAALPGAELVRISGAGHSVILERAEEVAWAVAGLVARVGAGVGGAANGPAPGCAGIRPADLAAV